MDSKTQHNAHQQEFHEAVHDMDYRICVLFGRIHVWRVLNKFRARIAVAFPAGFFKVIGVDRRIGIFSRTALVSGMAIRTVGSYHETERSGLAVESVPESFYLVVMAVFALIRKV